MTMATRKLSEFGQAFADARKGGMKEFTFKGKKYHTRTADEEEQPSVGGRPVPGQRVRRDMNSRMGEIDRETQGDAVAMKYKPRRTPESLTETDQPGTRVKYENQDADMPTFRKGGYVKTADGIAKKGKTRGTMV